MRVPQKDKRSYFIRERPMTTNINNSPEYACRTCAKQECGCKDTECQLPCHFYIEQAEQEPKKRIIVDFDCTRCGKHHDIPVILSEQAEQRSDSERMEPVAYLCPSFVDNFATGRYETCEQKDYGAFPVYTHPVRTKDLTESEIGTLVQRHTIDGKIMPFALCDAVIAAYKEKNKCL